MRSRMLEPTLTRVLEPRQTTDDNHFAVRLLNQMIECVSEGFLPQLLVRLHSNGNGAGLR